MDRLVDGYLRDEVPALVTLHPNQHAYQAGKSVKTALHQLVIQVEKEPGLGIFLDTEGVFNNTSYDSMCAALGLFTSLYCRLRLPWRTTRLQ